MGDKRFDQKGGGGISSFSRAEKGGTHRTDSFKISPRKRGGRKGMFFRRGKNGERADGRRFGRVRTKGEKSAPFFQKPSWGLGGRSGFHT